MYRQYGGRILTAEQFTECRGAGRGCSQRKQCIQDDRDIPSLSGKKKWWVALNGRINRNRESGRSYFEGNRI